MATKPTPPVTTVTPPVTTVTVPAQLSATASIFAPLRDQAAHTGALAAISALDYARKLLEVFGREFWRKASPSFKAWQEERGLYDMALKARNHPNPSVAHARLIKAAEEVSNPDKGKGTRVLKALSVRAKEDAIALYRAFTKEETKVGLDDSEKRIFSGLIKFMTETLRLDLNNLDK